MDCKLENKREILSGFKDNFDANDASCKGPR